MYKDVIKAMSGARTFGEHIRELQAILDKSPSDPQLAAAIQEIITDLMYAQARSIEKKVSSQKVRLSDSPMAKFKNVYGYCQQRAQSGEPDWMIAARKAGWTPPQT